MPEYDAVVVGAGPNGLSAAIELARNDQKVLVVEGGETIGGGARTDELTLPGFHHDVCSAVFALGHASPFFKSLDLQRYGLEWVQPDIPVAHALDDGSAAIYRSLDETADRLGTDGLEYRHLLRPLVDNAEALYDTVLGPIVRFPPHPLFAVRFGLRGLPSASRLAKRFESIRAKALISGLAGHATTDLANPLTGAMVLVLAAAAHTDGYPFAKGGSQALVDALAAHLVDLGGEVVTGTWVKALDDLPSASAYVLNLMPAAAAELAGSAIPARRSGRMRKWQHGSATFKVDFATSAPIPWRDETLRRAGTVHLGGTFDEVAGAEREVWKGRHAEHPFVILAQPTIFDPSRAPEGKHTVWAYAHVPMGDDRDVSDRVTRQIERFAPGFRETILGQHDTPPTAMAAYNPNNVGGDIGAGRFSVRRIVARPRLSLNPHRLGAGVFLCSAASPPGVGVHGMSGYHAARSVLRELDR